MNLPQKSLGKREQSVDRVLPNSQTLYVMFFFMWYGMFPMLR